MAKSSSSGNQTPAPIGSKIGELRKEFNQKASGKQTPPKKPAPQHNLKPPKHVQTMQAPSPGMSMQMGATPVQASPKSTPQPVPVQSAKQAFAKASVKQAAAQRLSQAFNQKASPSIKQGRKI